MEPLDINDSSSVLLLPSAAEIGLLRNMSGNDLLS